MTAFWENVTEFTDYLRSLLNVEVGMWIFLISIYRY